MTGDRTGWPVLYNELHDAGMSYSAIMILSRERGGTRFQVPKKVSDKSWLTQLVGQDNAAIMVELYAGLDLDFPLGPKSRRAELHEAMRRMDRAGKSYNEIAREAGVNRRTAIRQVKGVTERDKSQPDMFADHHPRPRNATKAN